MAAALGVFFFFVFWVVVVFFGRFFDSFLGVFFLVGCFFGLRLKFGGLFFSFALV